MTIHTAAAIIRSFDPAMADLFIARPFHRRAIVSAVFESMVAAGIESAYRTRVVLHRALDEVAADRADPRCMAMRGQASWAEQDRKWFSANYKLNRNGQERGHPFIVELKSGDEK